MSIVDEYLKQNPYKAPQKKKQTGKGGTLTSLISEGGALGGGAAGAAIGTAVLPGVGTLLGGALGAGIGAFGGRVAENKVRDDRLGIGDAAKEGLITGLLSAPGKGLKVGASAGKALAKGGTLEEALMQANNAVTKGGLLGNTANKVRTSAADRSAKGFGVKTTDKLLPDEADAITNFINQGSQPYGGIRAGNPQQQARDAQAVLKNVTKELDNQLNQVDRPINSKERTLISRGLVSRVNDDAGVTGTKQITDNYRKKILNAKSIRDLETIRKDADNLAYNTKGDVGGTAKAREAAHVRDAIDEFVTQLSPEYKAVKSDYGLAKKAAQLVSKEGGKDAKGLPLPFISGGITGNGVGGNTVATARNKINAGLSGVGGGQFNPTAMGARMGATGSLADAVLGAQGSMSDATSATSQDISTNPMMNDTMGQDYQNTGDLSSQENQNPYPRENLMYDIQRDPKHADEYIKLYQQYQEIFPEGGSDPLSAEASKIVSNANIGLQALNDFQGAISQDPSVLSKRIIPGRGLLGGAVGGALGTSGADAAAQQIVDVIARLRTGAAITNDEAKRFEQFIPQAGDPAAVQAQKLNYLRSQFQAVASRTGGSSGSSLEDALLQSGYSQ